MNLSEHIAKENLDQLTDAWKYLTPFQRKVLRLQVQVIVTRKRASSFLEHAYYSLPCFIKTIQTYSYPAHWI